MVSGLILAAGESNRMGEDVKQLLPYGEGTILGAVVATAVASSLDDVVVVTGYHADAVEAIVPAQVRVVRNPDPARGNHSSLLVGLEACREADAVVMLLGDQPQVDATVVARMVEVWHERRPWAAVAEYRGVPGHPFLLSADCTADLPRWTGSRPLWRHLVTEAGPEVMRVYFDRDVPIDVDTPDDYRRLIG